MSNQNTILIIDDDPTVRDTLRAILLREGYHLAFAAGGVEALTRLAEIDPDVILLDVMMPGMNGFEVCQHLKADERWQHVPIILVTALDSKEDMITGFDAGADDFLSKPVNSLELRARIRSMMRVKKQFDALQTSLNLREDLSRMIVHDMKNPIMAIMGFSRFLLKIANIGSEYLDDIEKIYLQAQRLSSFTNDLLLVAKMEAGKLILNPSTVDMNQLALEITDAHQSIARLKNINLVIDLPSQTQAITVDANLFQRMLDNLLSNALKFSPAGSTVTLRITYPHTDNASTLPGQAVRIEVLDEGPGIPQEHRQRIFDKFEIVNLKKSGASQIGLGLAFCKMVVEAHGGQISVTANQPTGAVFTVELW